MSQEVKNNDTIVFREMLQKINYDWILLKSILDCITTDDDGNRWFKITSEKKRKIYFGDYIRYSAREIHVKVVRRELKTCDQCNEVIDLDERKVEFTYFTGNKDLFCTVCESCFYDCNILASTDVEATSYIEDLEAEENEEDEEKKNDE